MIFSIGFEDVSGRIDVIACVEVSFRRRLHARSCHDIDRILFCEVLESRSRRSSVIEFSEVAKDRAGDAVFWEDDDVSVLLFCVCDERLDTCEVRFGFLVRDFELNERNVHKGLLKTKHRLQCAKRCGVAENTRILRHGDSLGGW